MPDELEQLRAELQILSGRIQAERNDEVRHGLQRGRLEAERFQLLVKMVEAVTASPVGSVQPAPELSEDEDDVADGDEGVTAPDHPGKYKPAGLPSVPDMITATLRAAGPGGLQTKQIAEFIRQKWWPEITGGRIACIAWSMKRRGLVEKRGQRYRIKPNGYASEAGGALGNGAAR